MAIYSKVGDVWRLIADNYEQEGGGSGYSVGDFVDGGYFVSNIGDGTEPKHKLLCAPKTGGESLSIQWKTTNTSTPGIASLWDGLSNTNNICNTTHPAANFCCNLTINGKNDWYLPSKDELNVLYANKTVLGSVSGAFVSPYYWSSNEPNATHAWSQSFYNGAQLNNVKVSHHGNVRAVRRLPL